VKSPNLNSCAVKSPTNFLPRVAEIMPHDPERSNCTSNLGIYTKFISSLESLHCQSKRDV
jgi:hypothetical protein